MPTAAQCERAAETLSKAARLLGDKYRDKYPGTQGHLVASELSQYAGGAKSIAARVKSWNSDR